MLHWSKSFLDIIFCIFVKNAGYRTSEKLQLARHILV